MSSKRNTHPDIDWVDERINGRGGSYSYTGTDGLLQIIYIGDSNRVEIWRYNFQLLLRYCRRKLWKLYLKCMGAGY